MLRLLLIAILIATSSVLATTQTWEAATRLMGVTTLPTYIPLANGKTLIELRDVPVAPSPSTARLYDIESILNGWGPIADLSDILVWHTADDVDGNGHADMLATRGRRRDYVLIRNAFTVQENSQPLSANQANKYPVSWANDSELFDVNGDGCKDNIRYMSSDQVVLIYGDSAEPFSRASIAGAKPQIPFHTVGILYCGYLSGKLCLLRKTSIDNTGKPDTTLWELDTLVQEDIQQKRDTVRCHNVLTWVQNVNLSVGTMKVICDSVWHFFDVGVSTAARVRLSGIDTHEPHSTFKTADGRLLKREQMYGHGREKAYDPVRVYGDRPFLAYWARGVQDDSYSPHFVDLLRIRDQMTLRSQLLGTMVLLPPYVDQGAINNAYLIPDQDNDGFEDVVVCYRSSTDTRTVTNVTDIFLTKSRSTKTSVEEHVSKPITVRRDGGGWYIEIPHGMLSRPDHVEAFDLQGRCVLLKAKDTATGIYLEGPPLFSGSTLWTIVESTVICLTN